MKIPTSRVVNMVHESAPPVRLVGAYHLGTEPYYVNLSEELSDITDNRGGIVHYEGLIGPQGRDMLTVRDRFLVKLCMQARFGDLYEAMSAATGLTTQKSSLNYDDPRWENHDISVVDMLNRLGISRAVGFAVVIRTLVEVIERIPEGEMSAEVLAEPKLPRRIGGLIGEVIEVDRNIIALECAQTHLRSGLGQPLALLWGDAHLNGLIKGFISGGYRLSGEIIELQPFQGIVASDDDRGRIRT